MIIDFTQYQDTTPTTKGDVVYLTNTMEMVDGRMWNNSTRSLRTRTKIPMIKFEIGDDPVETDLSMIPQGLMRALPDVPKDWKNMLDNRLVFELQRGSGGGEVEWLINGQSFDPATQYAALRRRGQQVAVGRTEVDKYNLSEIRDGGGATVRRSTCTWKSTRTMMHNGEDHRANDATHADDVAKKILVGIDPSN